MKHLSQVPPPPRPTAPRSRATSTTSPCARSRRTRPTATTRPRRWTPTSSGSRAGSASPPRPPRRRRRCSRGTDVGRGGDDDPCRRGRAGAPTYTPGRYYEYDEPPRRRSIWPWLLGLLLVALALVGGWFAWQEVQSQLSAAKPVAVPDVVGSVEQLAVQQIRDAGLKELIERKPNDDGVKAGVVFEQDPQPGDRTERGNFVTIVVSTGPSKVGCRTSSARRATRRSPS